MKKHFALLLTIALAVACTPTEQKSENELNNEQAEVASQLENGEFIENINGRDIHFVVRGEGPVCIALTNSWGFDVAGISSVLKPLEDHMTMVYFDPRGMGQSADVEEDTDMSLKAVREDANAIREYLGLEKAHFIGWSNGAMNLMKYADEYGDSVKSAIILHGTHRFPVEKLEAFMEKYGPFVQEWREFQAQLIADEISADEKNAKMKEFFLDRYFPVLLADQENKSLLSETFSSASFSLNHQLYANQESQVFDATENLKNVSVPCLFISGTSDMLGVEDFKAAADLVEGSQFVVFENSGHFSSLEETEKFVSTVVAFVKSIEEAE